MSSWSDVGALRRIQMRMRGPKVAKNSSQAEASGLSRQRETSSTSLRLVSFKRGSAMLNHFEPGIAHYLPDHEILERYGIVDTVEQPSEFLLEFDPVAV